MAQVDRSLSGLHSRKARFHRDPTPPHTTERFQTPSEVYGRSRIAAVLEDTSVQRKASWCFAATIAYQARCTLRALQLPTAHGTRGGITLRFSARRTSTRLGRCMKYGPSRRWLYVSPHVDETQALSERRAFPPLAWTTVNRRPWPPARELQVVLDHGAQSSSL